MSGCLTCGCSTCHCEVFADRLSKSEPTRVVYQHVNITLQEALTQFTDDQLQEELKRRKIAKANETDRRARIDQYNEPLLKQKRELERELMRVTQKIKPY